MEKGDISPLVGFDLYKETGESITGQLVGQTAANGVVVLGYKTHFLDRVIGQTGSPHPNMRMGVSISDILEAVSYGSVGNIITDNCGICSQKIYGIKCIVTINPNTGMLIQVNPRSQRRVKTGELNDD